MQCSECTNDIHVLKKIEFHVRNKSTWRFSDMWLFPKLIGMLQRSVRDLLIENYEMKIAWLARFIQMILHFLFWTFHQRVLRVAYSHWFSLVTLNLSFLYFRIHFTELQVYDKMSHSYIAGHNSSETEHMLNF